VDRSQIEHLLQCRRYADAYKALGVLAPSAWKDTYQIKCIRALGRHQEALKMAEEMYSALKEDLTGYPVTTSDRNNLLRQIALIYAESEKTGKACQILQVLSQKKPDAAALRREYAFALICDDQLDKAEEQLDIALELEPGNASSHARLASLYCRTGRVEAGCSGYSRAATLDPDNHHYTQRLVYWSNYSERTTQQSNFQLAKLWAKRCYPEQPKLLPNSTGNPRNSNPDRPLRVAFSSADFCAHAISFFVTPLLRNLDHDAFTLYAYSDTSTTDRISDNLRDLFVYWWDSSEFSDDDLTEQIREDQIDILIDLSGHTTGNRLGVFARRAAPVQVSWLGYPATTGLDNMDYRISDRIVDPIGLNEQYYSEELVRLNTGFLCYEPLPSAPDIAPTDGGEVVRLGSFNSLSKISSTCLDAWAAAMHFIPKSTLYLKRKQLSNVGTRNSVAHQFEIRGIDPERVRMETSKPTIEEHLIEYNHIDIALDTSPYNGSTTALEALWMGVPVVTMFGNTHASRVSASILKRIELGRLACKDIPEFCSRVKELNNDPALRKELRQNLRGTMRKSALMDHEQFGKDFGYALQTLWRDWCETAI